MLGNLWIHYMIHGIFSPDSRVIFCSMVIVKVVIVKSYYDLKKEL